MMGLVILPQALTLVIPGIVNNFIGLFMDTTLISVVGMTDFLEAMNNAIKDPVWAGPTIMVTGYVFAGMFYFSFCFGMARYSAHVEQSSQKDASDVERRRFLSRRPRRRRRDPVRRRPQMVRKFPRFAEHQSDRGRGERIVVCGPSGSGKSTLIRCVNRLEEHQRGSIVVDGVELTDDIKRIDEVRREVGMVFQSFNLFPHLTILENCSLAPIWVRRMPRRDAEELAAKLLARVKSWIRLTNTPASFQGASNNARRSREHCA